MAAYRVQAAADLEKAQRDDAERRKSEAVAAFALRKAREAEAEAARKAREEEARAEYRVMAEEFAKAGVAPGTVTLAPGAVQVNIHEVDGTETELEEDQAAGTA